VQPILTWLAKPDNSSIILAIVLINHRVIVAIAAIHNATKSAETVNLAIGCDVYVFWVDSHWLNSPILASSTILIPNVPQLMHCANHSCSVSSAPFLSPWRCLGFPYSFEHIEQSN
jgi:hypothetical protein